MKMKMVVFQQYLEYNMPPDDVDDNDDDSSDGDDKLIRCQFMRRT